MSRYNSDNAIPTTGDHAITGHSDDVNAGPIVKVFKYKNETERTRLTNLLNIAYFNSREHRPLSDMEKQCKLAKRLGVDVGINYHNEFAAKQFLQSVSGNLQNDDTCEVKNSRFISIMADGRTDISVTEQEVVYIRYLNKSGNADTVLAGIMNPDHAHTIGIFETIKKVLLEFRIPFETLKHTQPVPSLVCANFVGASVML